MRYDLIVIGSGPGGQKGAIAASKFGKRVALVERNGRQVGGVCVHTGTIPSKTMREAILHLTGFRQRDVFGERFRQRRHVSMDDLRRKVAQVKHYELDVLLEQFERNGIDLFEGNARFVGPHEVAVEGPLGETTIEGDNILIAAGTLPNRPDSIPFDGEFVLDSDDILKLERLPRSLVVVGCGVIGIEYAIMFATLGAKVSVVDSRHDVLEFCDREIVEMLLYHARSLGVMFRLGEKVSSIYHGDKLVFVELESGKRLTGEATMISFGRIGDSAHLNLEAAGLQPDSRGRLACNEDFQTEVSHIYAAGDIVGFPALASTSMEQGRRAVCHAFGQEYHQFGHMPYGLFTIPEIAMVGKTEPQLTDECVPYEVGIARFSEIARGQIDGDLTGMLKILFHRETLEVLGVHCIGDHATELVHIGQTAMALHGTMEYFRDAVFNYPTMAECYKVAAFDGLNRIGGAEKHPDSVAAASTLDLGPVGCPPIPARA